MTVAIALKSTFSQRFYELCCQYRNVKHTDPVRHKEGTGVENTRILENLARLSGEKHIPVVVRVPLIPGFNDTEENMRRMAAFILEKLPTCQEVNLLPYHKLGEGKKEQLERENAAFDSEPPEPWPALRTPPGGEGRKFSAVSGIEARLPLPDNAPFLSLIHISCGRTE